MSTPPPSTPTPDPVIPASSLVEQAETLPAPEPVPAPTTPTPELPPPPSPAPMPEVATKKICQNDKCKFECPSNYEYCPKCGKVLPESEAEKPICKNKKCGYVNPKGSIVCCMCGDSLLNNKSITKQDITGFIWDVVVYGLLLQFIVTYQTYITTHIWNADGFAMCIAFSILPAFANLYKRKRGVTLESNQQGINEANEEIREDNYRKREQYLKEREKNLALEERIKQLEAKGG